MSFFSKLGSFVSNWGAPIGAIAGGIMNFAGQSSANSMNRDIANNANALNYNMFQQSQAFNSAQALQQMAFQERMSSTAFQRGVADMRAAGINPILAATHGGASSPVGSSASTAPLGAVTGAPMQNTMSRAVEAFNSAIQTKTSMAQLKQIGEATRKISSDIDLNRAMQANTMANSALATAKLPREQTYGNLWKIPATVSKAVSKGVIDAKYSKKSHFDDSWHGNKYFHWKKN